MTIIVTGIIDFDPANREDAIAAVTVCMDATRAEDGCEHYASPATSPTLVACTSPSNGPRRPPSMPTRLAAPRRPHGARWARWASRPPASPSGTGPRPRS